MESKDNIYKNIFFTIIASLICFYIIQPLFSFFGNKLFIFVSQLIKIFDNDVYRRIALRDYDLDKYIYIYFIYLFFIIYVVLLFYFHKIYSELIYEISKLEERLNNVDVEIEEKKEIIDVQKEKETMSKQFSLRKKELKKHSIKAGVIIGIGFLLSLLVALLNYSTELTIKNKISIYENTKRIILPYITDLEAKTFESKFTLIKNEDDYDNLLNEMNDTIIKNGLMIIWVKNKGK